MTATPDDQQELEKEIEQTREQLGETVEALTAKVDVKARAQQEPHIPGIRKSFCRPRARLLSS